jgi:hypothetical protein
MSSDYPYYKYIKNPEALGMSDKGTLAQMGKDIKGLISYTQLLVTGKGDASVTGNPLGNRYFQNTGGQCTDVNGANQARYIYIDNIPDGSIPIVSSGMGIKFNEFRGLIPGVISSAGAIDPLSIMAAFTEGTTPQCQKITLETINNENLPGIGTHYVAKSDISRINPCLFRDNVNTNIKTSTNPVSKATCKSGFTNMMRQDVNTDANLLDTSFNEDSVFTVPKIPDDIAVQAFMAGLGGVGLFVLFRAMVKLGLIPSIKR